MDDKYDTSGTFVITTVTRRRGWLEQLPHLVGAGAEAGGVDVT